MTIQMALQKRIRFVRLPEWEPTAHIELPLLTDGIHGPWAIIRDVSNESQIFIGQLLTDLSNRYEVLQSLPKESDK